jgi:hypothetical protein
VVQGEEERRLQVTPTPDGSNPQGDEQVVRKEQIDVGDVVGLMRSFWQMSEELIHHLDRDEARALTPLRVHCTFHLILVASTVNLRRSNFLSSLVPQMVQPLRHGWRIWRCAFHFVTIPLT